MSIVEGLNTQQRRAVTTADEHLLVLAGAGSGKTRVLVHRIAWLIQTGHVSPYGILAVTFTNKAAAEMRGRIETILGVSIRGMWVGTFHALAHRLLRTHWQAANLPETFQVLDAEDQQRLIKRILRQMNLDEKKWPPRQAQWFINKQKDEGLRSSALHQTGNIFDDTMRQIYHTYEELCQRSGLIDFSELLLRSYELLKNNPQILDHYQQRFSHLLVDEFQDTNTIQYEWLKLLAGDTAKVMAVGDDDQSIYSWRGAQVGNIRRFTEDFTNNLTIRLEQNYRSTQTILKAANQLVSKNKQRMGKELWTKESQGESIKIYSGFNDLDEAKFLVSVIQNLVAGDTYRYADSAILYRSNAQSRIIEEQLNFLNIPYRVYGGFKFYERAEIKDTLAYLRLLANRDDDAAFERVVNFPTRGIGNTSLQRLRDQARQRQTSLWQASIVCINEKMIPPRAANALLSFLQLIDNLSDTTRELTLAKQTERVLHDSGLFAHYQKDRTEKGCAKIENLQELLNATRSFKEGDIEIENNSTTPLIQFLSQVALETGDQQAEEFTDYVHLMTLHAAKGLEFPLVFITGMEEGLFPHQMCLQKPALLEEERRLCYVGMTRAKQQLYFTYAETRRFQGGSESYRRPSRFLRELPRDCLQDVKLGGSSRSFAKRNTPTPSNQAQSIANGDTINDSEFRIGQKVKHAKFGEGIIINYEGRAPHTRLQINFKKAGLKWMVASYARLSHV